MQRRKNLVETRNLAEGMITSTDKMLEENSDKATDEKKMQLIMQKMH